MHACLVFLEMVRADSALDFRTSNTAWKLAEGMRRSFPGTLIE